MDVILTCYFDHFEKLPRYSLHDRRKRQEIVHYISTIIEGCSRGENKNTDNTARQAVMSILKYHECIRNSNETICMMGKYHNILYVALKLSYDWQVKDSATIASLLEHIYSCEKTFERLFVGAIFGTKAPFYVVGWKSDFESQEENVRAMVYFLDHACNAGLEFSISGITEKVRFVDVPIESCGKATALMLSVQLGLPDLVQILLRFGASVSSIFPGDEQHQNLIESLLIHLHSFVPSYPYNLVSCLQLLLRVMPTLDISLNRFSNIDITKTKKDEILEKYLTLINAGLIPIARCGMKPPELKHLCRCVIRTRLWENYQLPNGIRELKIPESLWRYLDVLVD